MDTKQTSTEMLLLLYCTRLTISSKQISSIQNLLSHISSEHTFILMLAQKHAVLPLLYKTLKKHFPKHSLTLTLKPYYLNVVQTNMAITTELIKTVSLLQSHHVATLCFKGPLLSQFSYGDITLRQYGDIDILIQKRNKEKATTLLKEKMFTPEIILHPQTEKTFFNAVNVLGFKSPKKDVFIEIHWELLSRNYAISWDEAILWKDTQTICIDNHPLETLSHTNHFLYLCTHGSKHLFERLSWVVDLDRYIQTQHDINWEEVFNRAKTLGILRVLCLSLQLTQTLLHTTLPKEIQKNISQDLQVKKLTTQLIVLHFTDTHDKRKGLNTFKFLWSMRENRVDKLRFAWYALFATKLEDFRYMQLPNYLAFLYPVLRPLRLIVKYLK